MGSEAAHPTKAFRLGFDRGAAFVAGGSGGLGAGVVRAFAATGSDVFFTYNKNEAAAATVQAEASALGDRVEFAQLSLESEAVEACVATMRERFGTAAT